jgi:hypothetical protein
MNQPAEITESPKRSIAFGSHEGDTQQAPCIGTKVSTRKAESQSAKDMTIDTFEFQPEGFMSHGRW